MTNNNECYIKIPIDCSNNAPSIGENGNWYIGDTDTGIKAQGKDGETGAQGPTGLQGPAGPQGIQGEPGANGKDADVSRIETLEADVSKLNSNFLASVQIKDCGIATVTLGSEGNSVIFNKAFTTPPMVLCQGSASSTGGYVCTNITSLTNSGFTFNSRWEFGTSPFMATYFWIAI